MKGSGGSGSGGILGGLAGIIILVGGLIVIHKFIPALFRFFLWGVIAVIILLIGLIVLIVVLASRSSRDDDKSREEIPLNDEQSDILTDARGKLMELRRVISQIHVMEVRREANNVCATLDKILQTLKEKPDRIRSSRQCLNYYIPTLTDVLRHFKELESKEQLSEDMKDKTIAFLKDVQTALSKYYGSLYENDKLDMEVDMEAMTIAIRRDGLL